MMMLYSYSWECKLTYLPNPAECTIVSLATKTESRILDVAMSSAEPSKAGILVNKCQEGNPLLRFFINVPYAFAHDVIPDYASSTCCAVFLSLKYHMLHPNYASLRIQKVGKAYRLRVLLLLVDDENNLNSLTTLNKLCFVSEFTLVLAWSNEECARYLETLKLFEGKAADSIKEKVETDFMSTFQKAMTSVRSVNKTDSITLLDTFGSFSGICAATEQQLILCPGLGEKKVKRLYQALHEPFK